jgi:multidrug resistance efflux pump
MDASVQDWLNQQCEKIPGARHGLVLLGSRASHSLPAAIWPASTRPPIEVYNTVRDTLLGKIPIQRASSSETSDNRLFSMPIRLGDRPAGALVIAVDPAESPDDDTVLASLRQGLARLYPLLAAPAQAAPGSSEALRLGAAILAQPDFVQACTAFANELALLFHCQRVSLGQVEKSVVRVMAVSHGSGASVGSEAFGDVEAAMEEAVDQGGVILYPAPDDAKPRITLAHAALARNTLSSVLTLPIVSGGKIEGAITLEASNEAAFHPDEKILMEHLVGLLAPVLILKRDAEATTWQRLRRWLERQWRQIRAPGINRAKLVAGGVALTLLLLTALPVPYRVTAPARIEGEVQRVLAAPVDGFLQQVHVRPGDTVKQGQPLIELAQQDLLLEQRKWQGERAQHENAYGAAMAKGDRIQLAVSMARMQEAQSQLELVQQRLARSSLTAPFDGIVAEGDLTQSLGAPVQKGHVLMTVAPLDRYRIIVEVDERDIVLVRERQTGTLATAAQPGAGKDFVVRRITPVARVVNESNVFEVEGRIEGAGKAGADLLRPGMKGVAKIATGSQPLGWVLFHRLTDWLRLTLWRLGG